MFASSDFANVRTARYLIPVIPAIAVLIAIGTVEMDRLLPFKLAWIPLIALFCFQAKTIPALVEHTEARKHDTARVEAVGDYLRKQGIKNVYCMYNRYAMNFALNEEFCFHTLNYERYLPYLISAERAREIIVLEDVRHFSEFIQHSGAKAELDKGLYHDFVPYEYYLEYLGGVSCLLPDNTSFEIDILRDNNLATGWDPEKHDQQSFSIRLASKTEICGIRFVSTENMPEKITLRSGENSRLIVSEVLTTGFSWWGQRPYYGDPFYHHQILFDPVEVLEMTVEIKSNRPWQLSEIQIFRRGEKKSPEEDERTLESIRSILKEEGVKKLYCGRWLCNTLDGEYTSWYRDRNVSIFESSARFEPIEISDKTAILAERGNAEICRQSFAMAGIIAVEKNVGPWVLFTFDSDFDTKGENSMLAWAGFACFYTLPEKWDDL